MDNYKGLYYKESKEQKFYENGAHFSYKELYKILTYLKQEQDKIQKIEENEQNKAQQNKKESPKNDVKPNIQIIDLIQKNNENNANKVRTRNVMNPVFYNNPNTLKQKNLSKNNKNNQINIGLTYNENKEKSKSRNYKNDYSLFYNKTSNQK